jgi:hypothetical protein
MLDRRAGGRAVWLLSWVGVLLAVLFVARPASAYPWMIRHQYQGCVPCHADPSGAGLLTDYGRAMGENVLRTRYGSKAPDEMPVYARFLFGVPTPDWLILGGSLRGGIQLMKTPGNPIQYLLLEMEADLKAQITLSRFRAYGSLGYMHQGAQATQITSRPQDNLVSREHWIGVDLGEEKEWLLRAGRIDIPFGIRFDEHDLLVRSSTIPGGTRTNINDAQQHGVAVSYSGQIVRGELMAILGNYQINPDVFRERGYAGFVEFSLKPWAAAGVSSMVTYAGQDHQLRTPHTIRQLHGLFTRLAPVEPLVFLAEADAYIITSDATMGGMGGTSPGMVGALQADVEPTQGLHFVVTGETWIQSNIPTSSGLAPPSGGLTEVFGLWTGVLWFFAPHTDVRFDFVLSSQNGTLGYFMLPQLHLYL